MIEKKYICDLCHATCASDTANGFLIGLYWEDFPSHGWVVVPSADANHHICKTCAESIKKIKIVEAKDER